MKPQKTIQAAPGLVCTPEGGDLDGNPLTPCSMLASAPREAPASGPVGGACLLACLLLAALAYRALVMVEHTPQAEARRQAARADYKRARRKRYRRWYHD